MLIKLLISAVLLFLLSSLPVCLSYHGNWYSQNYRHPAPEFWSWGYADDRNNPNFNDQWRQNVKQEPTITPAPTTTSTTTVSTTTVSTTTVSTTTSSPTTSSTTTTTEETPIEVILGYDPCESYDPPVPEFNRGLRVSDIKCLEYIWNMGQQQEKLRRKDNCVLKKLQEAQRQCKLKGYLCAAAISGRDTVPGEFPHMGAIGWKATVGDWIFGCGTSLISPKFTLTAAHCSQASSADTSIADPVPKIIRFGDKNIVSTESRGSIYRKHKVDANILRVIAHPQYAAPKKYYDIALIELETALTDFDIYIQPACLWSSMDTSSFVTKVVATGWGITKEDAVSISPELQAVDIDIVDSPTCDSLLRNRCNRLWCGVQEHQVCAGKLAGGVDTCRGDSGGPLQVRLQLPQNTTGYMHYLVGITSFGIGCARPNSPAIYTRIASFTDWIESIVWP